MNSGFKNSLAKITLLWGMPIGICLTVISCIEKIEIPDEFYTDNIAINSVLEPDSSIMINISKSLPPAGIINFEFIEDADVRIGIEGLDHEIACQFLENGWYTSSEIVLEADKDYEINVSIANKNLSSATRIPEKPVVENVHIRNDTICFSIVDDPNSNQYYLVTLMGFHKKSDWVQFADSSYGHVYYYQYYAFNIQCDDESIDAFLYRRVGHVNNATGFTFTDSFYDLVPDYSGESFLISDQTFQGETKEIHMKITERGLWFVDSIRKVDLLVHSIDYNYYQYLLTFAQYWTTNETPFTDRAKVYNNIDGGYGLFGSQNGVKIELTLPDVLFEE